MATKPDARKTKWKEAYFKIAKSAWLKAEAATKEARPQSDLMTYKVRMPTHLGLRELNIEHHVTEEQHYENKDEQGTLRIKFQFSKDDFAARLGIQSIINASSLPSGWHLADGKGDSLRIYVYAAKSDVPRVDIAIPAENQVDNIKKCALIARQLSDWLRELPGFRQA